MRFLTQPQSQAADGEDVCLPVWDKISKVTVKMIVDKQSSLCWKQKPVTEASYCNEPHLTNCKTKYYHHIVTEHNNVKKFFKVKTVPEQNNLNWKRSKASPTEDRLWLSVYSSSYHDHTVIACICTITIGLNLQCFLQQLLKVEETFVLYYGAGVWNIRPMGQNWPSNDSNLAHSLENVKEGIHLTVFS